MQIHLPETDFLENLGTGGPWTRGVSVDRKALLSGRWSGPAIHLTSRGGELMQGTKSLSFQWSSGRVERGIRAVRGLLWGVMEYGSTLARVNRENGLQGVIARYVGYCRAIGIKKPGVSGRAIWGITGADQTNTPT